MTLRLIEMLIPEKEKDKAEGLLKENELVLDFWYDWVSEKQVSINVIVSTEKSQNVLDELEENFSKHENFRIILTPLEAMIPRPEEEEKEKEEKEGEEEKTGISRQELYENISNQSRLSKTYFVLISLSAIVASIGVLKNDLAVIIGAMVIAPMIGPNIGLSLATTLADPVLGKKSLKTDFLGIFLALAISILIGLILTVDPNISFIVSRTEPGLADFGLALAAGGAGAVAFTRDVSVTLVGVMVALALLPALVVSGLLLGSGHIVQAGKALLLFLIYLTCINLSGVVTFLAEGIEPRSWWEAEKAKRMSLAAVAVWLTLLSALVVVIIFIS